MKSLNPRIVALAAFLLTSTLTLAQQVVQLVPLQPVIGNVEAVGSGQYGNAKVRVGIPFASPTIAYIALTGNDGVFVVDFYRLDGSPTGQPAPVRSEHVRFVRIDTGQGETGGWTGGAGLGSVLEFNVASYIAAAPPDASTFSVRSTLEATCMTGPSGGACINGAFLALPSAPDGVPGLGDNSDLLDKRFEIVRARGSLVSAVVYTDNSSWYGELRLTFDLPSAGPSANVGASLRSADYDWVYPPGTSHLFVANPNDTDATHLTPDQFEIQGFGCGLPTSSWQPISPDDLSSVAVVPGECVLHIYFDRKTSVFAPSCSLQVRCATNCAITDSFGNRVRSNAVLVQYQSCPGAPGIFQALSPANNSVAVPTTPVFQWAESQCRASYTVQIASDISMANLVTSGGTTGTQWTVPSGVLSQNSRYYWRVIASNAQGQVVNIGGPQNFRTVIPGDINLDGVVNTNDLLQLLGNFGVAVP